MVSTDYPFDQATLIHFLPNLPRDWILMQSRPSNQIKNFQTNKKSNSYSDDFF